MFITVLGSGGSMSHFRWNGGGDYKGKPWGEHLPTDSAVSTTHVMTSYSLKLIQFLFTCGNYFAYCVNVYDF